MKKILYAIVLVSAALSSCTLLDENPTTSLSEVEIFKTEGGVESLMTGCYQAFLGEDMMGGRLVEYLQCGSCLIHWKGDRPQSSWQQALYFTMYSQDQYNYKCLTSTYAAINRCNNVIGHIQDAPLSEKFRIQTEAEARLLRAILYYYAVRMWGDLPLILESPKNLQEANVKRTSYLEVYAQILDDLTFAEQNMRTAEEQKAATGDTGRANKWAATAWKACVYLQIGCILSDPMNQPFRKLPDFSACGIASARSAWEKALEAARAVIASGAYELAPTYTQLFRWTDPEDFQLKERIFALNGSNMSTGALSYVMYSMPQYPEGTANVSAQANNWGRYRPERWVFQKWASEYGGTLDSNRNDKLENVYIDCPDPRFKATYIYGSFRRQDTNEKYNVYPADGSVAGCDGVGNAKAFAPYFRKYLNPSYDANIGRADLYLLRFAEMYLCAAEASAELSTSVGDEHWNVALEYIEVLHARARATSPGATQPVWEDGRFSTKTELTNAIFWERIYEMGGEVHEWFDMRRRGAKWVVENISKPFNAFLQSPEQGISLTAPEEGVGYWARSYFNRVYPINPVEVRKGLLCAFPEQEILNNAALGPEDQNPYYVR